MSESNATAVAVTSPVLSESLLARRANRHTARAAERRALRELAALEKRFAGCLPAEYTSRDALWRAAESARNAAWQMRCGRRIDLIALLRQRDKDNRPVWAVANPLREISHQNGGYDQDGDARVKSVSGIPDDVYLRTGRALARPLDPSGFPALPPRVREIANGEKIRRHARWVGVLYQPEGWREAKPDPALIVEWKDRPGEYYCLALWGGDKRVIGEWLD